MKFVTAYTISCKKSKKDHNHWVAFSIYYSNKKYFVYCEECLNGKEMQPRRIAVFYTDKLARSFCDVLARSCNTDLEKFDLKKLRLKLCPQK